MRKVGILGLVILFAGLAAIAQQTTADSQTTNTKQSKATVYVYRYKQFAGSALSPSVFCDDTQLARMDNGRYFAAKIDPGKHTFHSNDQQSGLELDAKAGQEYFIRVEIATGFMKGHGRLVLMSAEQGSYELNSSKLKPLDSSKVVNGTLVSVDEVHPEKPSATQKPAVLVETH